MLAAGRQRARIRLLPFEAERFRKLGLESKPAKVPIYKYSLDKKYLREM